jgi:hypothetical protein
VDNYWVYFWGALLTLRLTLSFLANNGENHIGEWRNTACTLAHLHTCTHRKARTAKRCDFDHTAWPAYYGLLLRSAGHQSGEGSGQTPRGAVLFLRSELCAHPESKGPNGINTPTHPNNHARLTVAGSAMACSKPSPSNLPLMKYSPPFGLSNRGILSQRRVPLLLGEPLSKFYSSQHGSDCGYAVQNADRGCCKTVATQLGKRSTPGLSTTLQYPLLSVEATSWCCRAHADSGDRFRGPGAAGAAAGQQMAAEAAHWQVALPSWPGGQTQLAQESSQTVRLWHTRLDRRCGN